MSQFPLPGEFPELRNMLSQMTTYPNATLLTLKGLSAGPQYIRFYFSYYHIKYRILNMLKIKRDINQ